MSRGLRNNNPGNIRLSAVRWQGEIVPSQDKSFKQFSTAAYGYRALIKLLQNYSKMYDCNTIEKMIKRWAPASENNTEAYIKAVANTSGISRKAVVDVDNKEQICAIAAAVSLHENGIKANMADVEAGWRLL